MPYDGDGNFLPLPVPIYPAQPGEVIYAAYFNLNVDNLIEGLTAALPRSGEAAMTGPLRMAGNKISEVGEASADGEVVEYGQWQGSFYAPSFTQPTTVTPPLTDNGLRIPNTSWTRQLIASASINFPPIIGESGQLNTDGTTVFWRNSVPDFLLFPLGVI